MNLIPKNFFFDDNFDRFSLSTPKRNDMRCDIYEKDGNYHIEMDIPGFNKEDVKIEINEGHLTIKASKSSEDNEENKNYIRRERSTQEYSRSFYMGDVDEDNIKAEFIDGVLKITALKKEKVETKKIIEIE